MLSKILRPRCKGRVTYKAQWAQMHHANPAHRILTHCVCLARVLDECDQGSQEIITSFREQDEKSWKPAKPTLSPLCAF
jgi:hypothetical protein